MILRKWEKLPPEMQTEEVKRYYDILARKKFSILIKRVFDFFVSFIMIVLLLPLFIFFAILIKIDSKGPVFYRQKRITKYGKSFMIFKFRTMIKDADKSGTQITVNADNRVTRIGRFLRKYRLDEIPQLLNIMAGTMTFVGTRPEVPKYVEKYNAEMMATLLLPAGVTSEASIYFKDEAELLDSVSDVDEIYVEQVLPEKMYYNLKSIEKFGIIRDLCVIFKTVFAVLGKEYKGDYRQNKGL